MRFDGKNTKQRATSMRITELSGVTIGAHEGADVTIMKFKDISGDAEQLLKSVYSEALREETTEEAVYRHLEPMWQMNSALREAAEKIILDSQITDKQSALRESVMEYLNDVLSLFSTTQEAVTMANENKELEAVQADLTKAKAEVERLTAVAKMCDASKAYYDGLSTDEAKADFLKLDADGQSALVKMSVDADESFTTINGDTIAKSQAGAMYSTLKAQDAELRKLRDEQNFAKAREEVASIIPNVPGDAIAKVKAWQGLSKLDADQREFIVSTFKSANSLWKERKAPAGEPGNGEELNAEQKLDGMAKARAEKDGTTFEQAYAKVIASQDGAALLAQMEG